MINQKCSGDSVRALVCVLCVSFYARVCQFIALAIKYEILIVTVSNYQMHFALNDNAQFEVKFIIHYNSIIL